MLKKIVSGRWFALADLCLVILSGLLWISRPEIGALPIIMIAIIPWVVRMIAGLAPFKTTPYDWFLVIFLITACVGYWAAYDREAAWSKFCFIVLAVFLYYALVAQPKENFEWISSILFCIGVAVSIYFFLTQDFIALPRKIEFVNKVGLWIMKVIPRMSWTSIHPNYVAGIVTITTPFILFPAQKLVKKQTSLSTIVWWLIVVGCGVALSAVIMATSRGIVLAIASSFGVWILWHLVVLIRSKLRFRSDAVFPFAILVFLGAVVLFLYMGPANLSGAVSDTYYYGTGSRSELASRSLYIISAFPFTGGGLGSFPGLYSYYILGIPNMNVPNSHNLFLDVAIEQGLLGGLSIFSIFVMSILYTTRFILNANSPQIRFFSWLLLFALIIAFVHGIVDDYLYNGIGIMLLLFLFGLPVVMQPDGVRLTHRIDYRIPSYVALIVIGFFLINFQKVRSSLLADLGAVRMEKIELIGFPTNQWTDSSILPELEPAKASFHSALRANPNNRTANYRLGLIALLRQDFNAATAYLERAKQAAPNHRGIVKSLGYCYVWSGDTDKAYALLSQIPEAHDELEAYIWWWDVHNRPDLAEKASGMSSKLGPSSFQQ